MPATREQLLARWETEEGQALAVEVQQALNPAKVETLTPEIRVPLAEDLRQRLVLLPFADEVVPRVDLRGLHTTRDDLFLIQVDLSGARLDYATLALIKHAKLNEAILDSCVAINSEFRGDLSQVSLANATLNGAKFRQVNLSGGQLQGARMVRAELRELVGLGASFLGADLRFSDCLRADFRGADLREVDFTEATLKDVLFDEQTRLTGANLRGATMRENFRAFAQQSGALLGTSQDAQNFAELDVTIKILQTSQNPGVLAALPTLNSVRADLERNPREDWSATIAEALNNAGYPELVEEVFAIWGDTPKTMGYYI